MGVEPESEDAMMADQHGEFMTMKQAATYLHVSHVKLTKFIDEGLLSVTENPFDRRTKLIPAAEVEALSRSRKSYNPKIDPLDMLVA